MQEFEVNCRKLKSAMKPITYKKIPRYVVLSILFLTILLGFRWIWSESFTIPKHPEPVNGLLDLRGWDLANTSPISLDGEWEFYPQAFISNRDVQIVDNSSTHIQVPGDWRNALPHSSSSFGYGTYRLRILLDPSVEEVSLWAQKIQTSSIIEMNGTIVAEFGQPATHAEAYQPERTAFTTSYALDGSTELNLWYRQPILTTLIAVESRALSILVLQKPLEVNEDCPSICKRLRSPYCSCTVYMLLSCFCLSRRNELC